MLSYDKLKDRARDFLAATGLTLEEFQKLLPAFRAAYARRSPLERTREGKVRQRRAGGGAKGALPRFEDKLLSILVYQKTNPLQTRHALQFNLSQPQANFWIHQLLPVLHQALGDLGLAPARDASRVAHRQVTLQRPRFHPGGHRTTPPAPGRGVAEGALPRQEKSAYRQEPRAGQRDERQRGLSGSPRRGQNARQESRR
jgi:hypothetical protein